MLRGEALGEVIGGESYAMSFLGWFFDYPDSSNWLEPFAYFGGLGTNVTDSETNEPGPNLTNPELITLLSDAALETDAAARDALYSEAAALWADDVVTIPLWVEPERVFYWDYITGDPAAATPESLNIGPTTNFEWTVLDILG